MFPALKEAVEQLSIPLDGPALQAVIALRDRLDATIAEAVGAFDAAALWDIDLATSMTAWLRSQAGMSRRDAAHLAGHAKRLRSLPVTAAAWQSGALSSGQVDAILAVVPDRHLKRFADHEAALVPTLAPLSVPELSGVMAEWRAKADALADEGEGLEHRRSLHASKTLDGRLEVSGTFDAAGGDVVSTALRLASSDDVEGEPARTPAERRADALVDLCRNFLDNQRKKAGGRHRPHVNVVVDLDDLVAGRGGETIDGTPLDQVTLSQLLCDSALHRVLMAGRSTILDYGTATRTIPAPLWNALVIRDRHCRFGDCDRPPEWCEGHHVVHVENGGETNLENIVLGCSRHHHLIHMPGWHCKLAPDGKLEVTAPDGRHWITYPPGATPPLC
ncbi:MAG: DUF222 domain-containing protein [Acidimicrobiales bacterium]